MYERSPGILGQAASICVPARPGACRGGQCRGVLVPRFAPSHALGVAAARGPWRGLRRGFWLYVAIRGAPPAAGETKGAHRGARIRNIRMGRVCMHSWRAGALELPFHTAASRGLGPGAIAHAATPCPAPRARGAAGPVSRLGSFEPGDKTGLRLSPNLAPSTSPARLRALCARMRAASAR